MKEKEKISQQEFENIEAFLLNKLPENESQAFQDELERNPELKNEVEVQREMMLAVEAGEMKNQMNVIHQKLHKKSTYERTLMIAASIAIFLSVGIWLVTKPDKADKLFAMNMTVDPGLPVPMSATKNYNFYDAMVDYKSEKYDLALSKWKPMLQQHPDNDTLNYYVGSAIFNQKKYAESVPLFEKVSSQNTSAFSGKSEWYLALCFLKMKDFGQLKNLASQSTSDYAEEINQLYQKLE